MIEISKDFQIDFSNSNSNRCITILAKHLRDLLAEERNVGNVIESFNLDHFRESVLNVPKRVSTKFKSYMLKCSLYGLFILPTYVKTSGKN
jgi:hypothetical protein